MRRTGEIRAYTHKGYGFIRDDADASENFFHITDIEDGTIPEKGIRCSYEIGTDRQGRLKAIKVKRTDGLNANNDSIL